MIRLQSVSKSYGADTVVDRLSFEVEAGQTLCLIGSSGSGKSTTLRMINRLIEPSGGSIEIQDQDVTGSDPVRLRRGIGYVIQQIGLFPHLSVAGNIAMMLEVEKWPRERIKARVEELLQLVQLEPGFAGRYPHQLSGGQQQRVGVARALALNPPIILLDEPFAALDPLTRSQLQNRFLELQQRLGITAVIVTHDLAEAFKCGDKIALMEKGKLIQIGTPSEILHKPASPYVSEFVRGQSGAEQLLELPVGKLGVPVSEAGPGWQLDAKGQLIGWQSPEGWTLTVPLLDPRSSLREALKQMLGSPLPGLAVGMPNARPEILLAAEIRELL